jgi:hypothetical protein
MTKEFSGTTKSRYPNRRFSSRKWNQCLPKMGRLSTKGQNGEWACGRKGERARRRGAILRVGRFGSLRWRVGANTLIPDGLNDGSQGIPRTRMRVKIRRKPWSVPRLRGRGEQGLRLGTRRV